MRERAPDFRFRFSCFFWNIWYGVCATGEGMTRGGRFGLRIAPQVGMVVNLVTGFLIPALFACCCGLIGAGLGILAFIGSVGESFAQFVRPQPYKMPISRILVDWMTF